MGKDQESLKGAHVKRIKFTSGAAPRNLSSLRAADALPGLWKSLYLIFTLTNYYLYGRDAEVSWDRGPVVWSDVQALL